jgi:hypothetical protein
MTTKFIDKGLDLIRSKTKKLSALSLTIGYQGDKAEQLYKTGISVATVATYQEFGTVDIPARSWLRASVFEFRDKIVRIWSIAYQRMLTTRSISPEDMLASIGRQIVKLIERKITASRSWAKPNAPSTVAGKGFDYPLHEEFIMSRSVTWAVRGRSGTILSIGGSSG